MHIHTYNICSHNCLWPTENLCLEDFKSSTQWFISSFFKTEKQKRNRRIKLRETGASLVAQMVRNLPATKETRVQSLSWKDPLEKGMATYSSILAWRIPCTKEPGGLQDCGVAKSWTH